MGSHVSKQFTIIDGYNVLHVNGFLGQGKAGPGTLEKARHLLLGILAREMDVTDRQRTTVIFDSREPDLPNQMTIHDVLVEFANEYENADELISYRISRHSAPKQLTVVSSDHQVQRAASVRGATVMDSDQWLEQLASRRSSGSSSKDISSASDKPSDSSAASLDYWKNEFGINDNTEFLDAATEPDQQRLRRVTPPPKAADQTENEIFPPGYADDLFEE